MDAKDKEIAQLRAELKESKDAHESDAMDYASKVDEMRTELNTLKSQKPIGYWRHTFAGKLCINKSLQCDIDGNSPELPDSTPLYARPVPAIHEGYALVQTHPTMSQIQSGLSVEIRCDDEIIDLSMEEVVTIYKVMIAAAKEQS